jgi:molecular chaperone DnaJ
LSIDLAYAELGLPLGASEAEVKAAWRRLVSRWHPDRNTTPHAVQLMQRINRAYEQIRLAGFAARPSTAAESTSPPPTAQAQTSSSTRSENARVVRRKVKLSLEEAALGCMRALRGSYADDCSACDGAGTLPPTACSHCKGTGRIRRHAWYGWVSSDSECEACGGTGVVRHTCTDCEGTGKASISYRRTVRIPPGVRHGDVLCADGGSPGDGGFDGMLELQVQIGRHKLFELGEDGILRCEMPVDGFAWLGGAWIEVPTVTGLQQMRLHRGKHVYRLRGQGMPQERGASDRGDFIVTVVPSFPETLSHAQQHLLDELNRVSGQEGSASAVQAWRRKVHAWEREGGSRSGSAAD